MKKILFGLLIIILILAFLINRSTVKQLVKPLAKQPQSATIIPESMEISSSAFKNNQPIPKIYGCQGKGINPPLEFTGIPKEAKSLVLIVDDPDAPMGTFVHWVIYNIPPQTLEIAENSFPKGAIAGLNSLGNTDFVAPCPPSGTHRYFFKLYALNTILNLEKADKKAVEEVMKNKIINTAQLIGLYSK